MITFLLGKQEGSIQFVNQRSLVKNYNTFFKLFHLSSSFAILYLSNCHNLCSVIHSFIHLDFVTQFCIFLRSREKENVTENWSASKYTVLSLSRLWSQFLLISYHLSTNSSEKCNPVYSFHWFKNEDEPFICKHHPIVFEWLKNISWNKIDYRSWPTLNWYRLFLAILLGFPHSWLLSLFLNS